MKQEKFELPEDPETQIAVGHRELIDLMNRPDAWIRGLEDFDPQLSQGQRFVLAILQTAAKACKSRLPSMMDRSRTSNAPRARRVAMWLLAVETTLNVAQIGELFQMPADTVTGYLRTISLNLSDMGLDVFFRHRAAEARTQAGIK